MRLAFLLFAVAFARSARAEDAKPLTAAEISARMQRSERAKFKTAQVVGKFESWLKEPDRKQVTLISDGRFIGIYDDPRMRIDYEFATKGALDVVNGRFGVVESNVGGGSFLHTGKESHFYPLLDGTISQSPQAGDFGALDLPSFPFGNVFHLEDFAQN